MIAVDTNVLVRFFVRDDEKQYRLASSLLQKTEDAGDTVFISNIVLVELMWVLSSGYNVLKIDIVKTVAFLLSNALFRFSDSGLVRRALEKYQSGPGDFSDYLIGSEGMLQKTVTTYTFDRRSSQDKNFTLLR